MMTALKTPRGGLVARYPAPGPIVESTGTGALTPGCRCPCPDAQRDVGEARHPRGAGDSRSGRPAYSSTRVGRTFSNTGAPAPVAAASVAGRRRGTPRNLETSSASTWLACPPLPRSGRCAGCPGFNVRRVVGCNTRDAPHT